MKTLFLFPLLLLACTHQIKIVDKIDHENDSPRKLAETSAKPEKKKKPFVLNASFGFESGNFDDWSLKRLPAKNDAGVVTNPVRFGKYAGTVTLSPGVRYKDGWKNELSDLPLPLEMFDKEVWYRISHYLPTEFAPEPGNSCMLAQWHNAADIGFSPLMAHRYFGDKKLRVTVAYGLSQDPKTEVDTTNEIVYENELELEKWHDFVYRTVWSRGGTGEVQGWHNGKLVINYRGPIGYAIDYSGPYFKTGVYCAETPTKPLKAFVDEYRRGATKEDVLLPGETLEIPAK